MSRDLEPIGAKLNILMGARHLTVLKAGYSTHRSWFRKLLSRWRYVPFEEYTVAYFTEPGEAHDYIEWAWKTGPRPIGHRFRTDSVLAGFDRAWVHPFFTRLPINPKQHDDEDVSKKIIRLRPKGNN